MLDSKADRRFTRLYQDRADKRAFRSDVEDFVMAWGTETRAAGATHITLLRRDLPRDLQDTPVALRAKGWIVVVSDDGSLITCYRRNDAWRFVRQKSQMRPRRRSPRE